MAASSSTTNRRTGAERGSGAGTASVCPGGSEDDLKKRPSGVRLQVTRRSGGHGRRDEPPRPETKEKQMTNPFQRPGHDPERHDDDTQPLDLRGAAPDPDRQDTVVLRRPGRPRRRLLAGLAAGAVAATVLALSLPALADGNDGGDATTLRSASAAVAGSDPTAADDGGQAGPADTGGTTSERSGTPSDEGADDGCPAPPAPPAPPADGEAPQPGEAPAPPAGDAPQPPSGDDAPEPPSGDAPAPPSGDAPVPPSGDAPAPPSGEDGGTAGPAPAGPGPGAPVGPADPGCAPAAPAPGDAPRAEAPQAPSNDAAPTPPLAS
ncbi:hypothetical protein GCM10023340_35890 [Nocardioides marinquilinus]|uniref:Uncharacterized protein n=2 Tax=Nocardioides marinquilinus TaxID=1210400 RepID=A0ABP9PWY7_9ACTN